EMAEGIVAAVDIGTTTIAMSSITMPSTAMPSTAISPIAISSQGAGGRVLRTVTGINHQRAYGADVISRIDASNHGKGAALQESILGDLADLRAQLGLPQDVRMIVSGNSTMEHLLQKLPCQTLGVAPYTPVDISLHMYENMQILPGISTFVGADIVSGIVACGMDQSDELCILVDLGTNGEMAIGNRDRIVSASTAAGPAFEGGNISCGVAGIPGAISSVEIRDGEARIRTIGDKAPVGLCGTGVLEVMYELLKEEIVDETGLMDDEYADDGFPLAEGIVFTAKDIREVQLAKAAVRAGMEVLLQEFGADYEQVGKLYLAGGFGQKIDLVKAVGIGLLPEELLGKIRAVGNSSLAGAVMAAQDPEILRRMERVAATAEETALAENPRFSDLYMEHMFFPEEE
ncbi:MAG: ASKHA domain-containing protein, partial [Eubacteriales bacterium]|nr:ASKHA domain-containing protein [Eubacteriales bacterium]